MHAELRANGICGAVFVVAVGLGKARTTLDDAVREVDQVLVEGIARSNEAATFGHPTELGHRSRGGGQPTGSSSSFSMGGC